MKEIPIVPFLQLGNNSLSFGIQTIKSLFNTADGNHHTFHSHTHYEMIWVIKGAGTLCADLREFPIGNDTIFCSRPNQVHWFQLSEDMEGFVFSFTDSFFKIAEQELDGRYNMSFFQIVSQSIPMRIGGESIFAMNDVATLMIKEYENQFLLRMEFLIRYFRIFLMHLARQVDAPSNLTNETREAVLVKAFVELLDKNFKKNKMVSYYAENLYVSPNYLNRVVKISTGFSARHHIKQRVLLEAKRLGLYSNAGMKHIAYSLGFSDSAHFSKFFKSGSGTNFSDFKNLKGDVVRTPCKQL